MAHRGTEALNEKARGIDIRPPLEILALLAAGQSEAAAVVPAAIDAIARAAELAADAIASGHRLIYVGAGSSGLMAMADALELPGTYGIPRDRIAILLAGGAESLLNLAGAPEDDMDAARAAARREIAAGDCVIAVSASGSTPYAVAVVEEARALGAKIIGVANNPDRPLLKLSDAAILLETPPELVSGSTRMGAGTAQKIALNMLSTLMAIRLGHVHDGLMVNLVADNIKLRERAARIVSEISGVEREIAARHVEAADGAVKAAVMLAAGVKTKSEAEAVLNREGGNLRAALTVIGR